MSITRFSSLEDAWNSLELTLFEHGLFHGDRSWNYPNMVSPFHRLYFIMEGEASLSNPQGRWEFLPGYVYLIPAGSCYSYACSSVIHKFYLHFNLALLPGVDLFGPLKEFRAIPCPEGLLDSLLAEAQKESLSGVLHIKALIWDVIHRFFQETVDETGYLNYFKGFYRQQQVLAYLSTHLSASLRVQDLADALGIPSHLLSRSFRQDTGYGLKEYMENLLLQKARHLLLHTTLPVCQISELLGFADPLYFSRFFKKQEELSPREYRKAGYLA